MALAEPAHDIPDPQPGRILKLLIEASNVDYLQVANLLEISKPSLSERISGKTRLQMREVYKLAKFFGVEPGIFFEDPMGFFTRMSTFSSRCNAGSAGLRVVDAAQGAQMELALDARSPELVSV